MYEQNRAGTLTVVDMRDMGNGETAVTIREWAHVLAQRFWHLVAGIAPSKRAQLRRLAKKVTGNKTATIANVYHWDPEAVAYRLVTGG